MQISINAKTHASVQQSGLPAWLAGKPLNAWTPVGTQSAMGQMDLAPLVAAGLTNNAGADIGYGAPTLQTALLYMGGALRLADSDFLISGGGGARAWAGNDWRGLRLLDDNPRWGVRKNPSPASQVWFNSYHNQISPSGQVPDPTNSYMRNGVDPTARHAYWTIQFCDQNDSAYYFGAGPSWEQDSTPDGGGVVNRLDWSTKQWDAPGTQAPYPVNNGGLDAHWIVKNPLNGHILYSLHGQRLYEYDPIANTHTLRYTDPTTEYDRRAAVIDPTRAIILMIGLRGGIQNRPVTQSLAFTTPVNATFTGPFAASINETTTYWGGGLVYDPILDLFLYYQDDGFLYTIKWLSNASYYVDRLAVSGTPPPAGSMSYVGNCGIWGKMQYVPSLKGAVILAGGGSVPTFFVKTA